jgi:DNA-binding NarL/FixJ family response regulator
MGGKEAIERLREIDPEIKAIVSSGYSNDPIMSEYRKYGFRGVISKPYKIEDLSEIVGRVTNEGE